MCSDIGKSLEKLIQFFMKSNVDASSLFTYDSKIKIYNLPFKIPLSFCVLQIRRFYKYIIVTCSNLVGLIVSHHFRDNRVRISFQSTWTPLP